MVISKGKTTPFVKNTMALLTSTIEVGRHNPKILFFEEPAKDNGRTEQDLCLVIMQENIIPTYCINFSLIGYTYEQLKRSYLFQPNPKDKFAITGKLYHLLHSKRGGKEGEYEVELDYNNCSEKGRRKQGVELVNLLLKNYMVFNPKNISHKGNQDTITANPTLNEFYSELDFEKKQDYNDVIFVKNLIVEQPSRRLLEKPLAIPKKWKKSN